MPNASQQARIRVEATTATLIEYPPEGGIKFHTKFYTVEIQPDMCRGYFEHNTLGEDRAGGLWFDETAEGVMHRTLTDYDGVGVLPSAVVKVLREAGFVVDDIFE